jgi:hypothetical protein
VCQYVYGLYISSILPLQWWWYYNKY